MNNVTAKSYTLRTENGQWLGQIVLTSDGLFSSVTDYGNFSFAWRSIGEQSFQEFLSKTDVQYFGGKMYQGMTYLVSGKQYKDACNRFAKEILPELQKVLKAELESNNEEVPDSDLVLNVLQQVEITDSNSGNKVIKDIDDVVNKILNIFKH